MREVYERSLALGFPQPVTDRGENIFSLWLGSVVAGAAVGFFVAGLILFAVVRYRKVSDDLPRQVRYNLPIEVLYTVVPFVIVAVLFYYTVVSQNFVNKLSSESEGGPDLTIGVVGFQWNWQFRYEAEGVQVTGQPGFPAVMVVPTDRTIRFVETSPDVIHSFFVPKFLFKRDVIPGRTNTFELTIKEEGEYIGRCAEYCGEKHPRMNFYVRAVSPQEYDAFIAGLKRNPGVSIDTATPIATGSPAGALGTSESGSNE